MHRVSQRKNFCRNTTMTSAIMFGFSQATVRVSLYFSDSWDCNFLLTTQYFFLIFPLFISAALELIWHLLIEISFNFSIHLLCRLCQPHSSPIIFCRWAHPHPSSPVWSGMWYCSFWVLRPQSCPLPHRIAKASRHPAHRALAWF